MYTVTCILFDSACQGLHLHHVSSVQVQVHPYVLLSVCWIGCSSDSCLLWGHTRTWHQCHTAGSCQERDQQLHEAPEVWAGMVGSMQSMSGCSACHSLLLMRPAGAACLMRQRQAILWHTYLQKAMSFPGTSVERRTICSYEKSLCSSHLHIPGSRQQPRHRCCYTPALRSS